MAQIWSKKGPKITSRVHLPRDFGQFGPRSGPEASARVIKLLKMTQVKPKLKRKKLKIKILSVKISFKVIENLPQKIKK